MKSRFASASVPVPQDPVPTPDAGNGNPPVKKPPTISRQEGIGGA